jgi:hypothetical protein
MTNKELTANEWKVLGALHDIDKRGGRSTTEHVAAMTGLTVEQAERALKYLQYIGYVKNE